MEVKSVAFTGHRPQVFRNQNDITWVREQLLEIVGRAAAVGAKQFISGGALGVDQWAALAVLMTPRYNCKLTIARPFPSQDAVWNPQQKAEFQAILGQADEVIDISPDPYASWKYLVRDKWMVEQATVLVAVWDGRPKGGTYHTYSHALALGKPIYRIDPLERRAYWVNNGN